MFMCFELSELAEKFFGGRDFGVDRFSMQSVVVLIIDGLCCLVIDCFVQGSRE